MVMNVLAMAMTMIITKAKPKVKNTSELGFRC
jgi:hypothetical protein